MSKDYQNLSKQILTLKHNGTAGQQIFIQTLAKELRHKEPRPICPKCLEPLTRIRIKTDGGDVRGWACEC